MKSSNMKNNFRSRAVSSKLRKFFWVRTLSFVMIGTFAQQGFAWDSGRDGEHWKQEQHQQIQREREALNRERERMHREFDRMNRELDQRNREIDQWQNGGHHHDQQERARIANQKRDDLNRERDRLNRERDRMNREFDERNRELDRRNQQVDNWRNQHRQNGDWDESRWRDDRSDQNWHDSRYVWVDGSCFAVSYRDGRKTLKEVSRRKCGG